MLLMTVSFPIMYFLVGKCVSDTNYFSEETVIPPEHVRAEKGASSVQMDDESRFQEGKEKITPQAQEILHLD